MWRKKIFSERGRSDRARPTTGSDRGSARSNLTRYEFSTLWWNLHRLSCYIDNNAGTLVNYGARYHKGLPISSSIAESAVNQVVSHRMAKKQQMRWTDEGAHCLVQVRVAVLKVNSQ